MTVVDALAELMRVGFQLVLAGLLPLIATAAVAAIVAGLLGGALGLRDAALGQMLRALAVVLALLVIIEQLSQATVEFAARSWAGLDGREPNAGDAGR